MSWLKKKLLIGNIKKYFDKGGILDYHILVSSFFALQRDEHVMQDTKKIYLSLLYDFYGQFLTEKQKKIVELYVNEDLTLGEISQHMGISRQGVYDSFKKAEQVLEKYESKLKLADRFYKNKALSTDILNRLKKLYEKYKDEEILNIINSIQEWQENV